MITENNLKVSAEIPLKETIVERKSVKRVKLAMNPIITPTGRDFPIAEERMIGKIGKIQGDKIVTMPAKKAKIISRIITTN